MNSYKPSYKHSNVYRYFVISIFVCNFGLILWLWQQNFDAQNLFLSFGRLAGLIAFYLILWQLLMMGRMGWLEPVFGHDRLSRWHHKNGIVAWIFLGIHPLFILIGYGNLSILLSLRGIVFALIAYAMFMSIIPISLTMVRKRLRYELWYAVHVLLYGAIFLVFWHQLYNGQDLQSPSFRTYWQVLFYGTFAMVLWYRFLVPLWRSWRGGFLVSRMERETHDVISIYIAGTLDVMPGQFVIVRFLARGFWWEVHPFTVSKIGDDYLRITPKAVGDFTSKLPSLPIGTPVFIEGPLGRFNADRAGAKPVLLIAGGIGITPLGVLFEEFSKAGRHARLIYTARSDQDFALKGELDQIGPVDYTTQRLTADYIKATVPDVANRFVYLCGPPPMMAAVREILAELGVPKRAILYEKFSLG